jgi:hypothetical protein
LINKEKAKDRTFTTKPIVNKNDTIRKRPFHNNDTRTSALFLSLHYRSFLASEDGTLFQVRVIYTYLPLHNDELSMKPNDIINVTRMVCLASFFLLLIIDQCLIVG